MINEFGLTPEQMGLKPEEMLSDFKREKMKFEKEKLAALVTEEPEKEKPKESENNENLGQIEKAIETSGEKIIGAIAMTQLGMPITKIGIKDVGRIIERENEEEI